MPSTPASGTPSGPLPGVEEIERRIGWRVAPVLTILMIFAALAAVAVATLLIPERRVSGFPDDPDALAARARVIGRLTIATGELRYRSELLGASGLGLPLPVQRQLAAQAESRLLAAQARSPHEPRLSAALGDLELTRRAYARAERRYRGACDFVPHCAWGHLGLGLTLALESESEPDPSHARTLSLEAVGQFATVEPDEPEYDAALYDRALLLAGAGRHAEARKWSAAYFARDSASTWAERLRAASR